MSENKAENEELNPLTGNENTSETEADSQYTKSEESKESEKNTESEKNNPRESEEDKNSESEKEQGTGEDKKTDGEKESGRDEEQNKEKEPDKDNDSDKKKPLTDDEIIAKRKKQLGLFAAGGVIVLIVIIVFIVLISTVILFFATKKPTVDLNDYVIVTYEGYDGIGRANVSFDYDALQKKYGKKIDVKNKYKNNIPDSVEYDPWDSSSLGIGFFKTYARVYTAQTDNLSNGDDVHIEWDVNEDQIEEYIKVNVKYDDFDSKVKGLEKVDQFDPFETVSLEFTGFDGKGSAIFYNDSNEFGNDLNFVMDNWEGFSNGDVATLKVEYGIPEDEFVEKYHKIPSTLEKEYEVNSLSKYIQSFSEIDSDLLEKMKKQATDSIQTKIGRDMQAVDSIDYIGYYFFTEKKGLDLDNVNVIDLIFAIHYSPWDREDEKHEMILYSNVAFVNLFEQSNGEQYVDINTYWTHIPVWSSDVYGPGGYWWAYGYKNLDGIYTEEAIPKLEKYDVDINVKE